MIGSGVIESGWTTADYAFVISLFSATIALISLGWSIWSKFIYPKPRVKIHVGVSYCDSPANAIVTAHHDGSLIQASSKDNLTHPSVSFSAINHGPGDVVLQLAVGTVSKFWLRHKNELAAFNPYNSYPTDLLTGGAFSGGIPKELKVGETFTVYFPIMKSWVESENLRRFGFSDSFGRIHLCSKIDGRNLMNLILNPPVGIKND
ncbi:MAG: hypothetical protein GQ535_13710 [Rhodobacteraceae bacterium]|nr:hypothetical protein [Paracoccaceae bacterium]